MVVGLLSAAAAILFFSHHFYFPAQILTLIVRGFNYPQRPSGSSRGHACLPFSLPARAFTHTVPRVEHSHFSAIMFIQVASNFTNSCSRTPGLSTYKKESLPEFEPTTSTSMVTRPTIEPPGTPTIGSIKRSMATRNLYRAVDGAMGYRCPCSLTR